MSEPTLFHHFKDLQQWLKRFSLLAENKHTNIMTQFEKIKENWQRSYVSKVSYLSLAKQMNSEVKKGKSVIFDQDISDIYSYSIICQIKEMLRAFKNDSHSLRLIIKDVILNWKKNDQIELAEWLVNCFLWRHDSVFPYAPLAERLYDIVDVEMQMLSEKGRLDSFLSGSFSMKIFDQIAKLPEWQNYVKQTMSRIYETIDLDYLETINLEEAAYHCKNFIDKNITNEEIESREEDRNSGFSNRDGSESNKNEDRESELFQCIFEGNNEKDSNSNIEVDAVPRNRSHQNPIRQHQFAKSPTNKRRDDELDLKLAGKLYSVIEEDKNNMLEGENNRSYSISMMKTNSSDDKTLDLKDLQQKFELTKFFIKTILQAIFVTPKYIPTIIRIFLKIVSDLYEKHSKINSSFYCKIENQQTSESDQRKTKNEIHRLLIDIIASKWLVNSLFIYPDRAGLIINRPIEKLRDLFIKLSKIFIYSLRGRTTVKNIQEESYIIMFSNFIDQHIKNSKRFIRSVLNINTENIIPRTVKDELLSEVNSSTKREYK